MHEGHRERMRDRYMAFESFEGFSDFEFLEMLLYYSKPRGDTNPCAHELIERFGSIKQVFEASVDELCGVKGVGLNSAILVKIITEGMRRYAEGMFVNIMRYDRMSLIKDYLYRLFLGLDHERLYMLMFNDRMNMIDCVLLSKGCVNSTNVSLRMITEKIVIKKATGIILAHNHPNGMALPSEYDLEVTDNVKLLLDSIDSTLIEHFIVSDTKVWPIMRRHYSLFRQSPITGKVESHFYETFYDLDESEYSFRSLFGEKQPQK